MGNSSLSKAKEAKNDEFYTQYEDIQKELNNYEKHFEGKTVLCNCDDPFESNFCKFFLRNFNYLKLKRLICTSYNSSPFAGSQLSFFDILEDTPTGSGRGYVMDVTSVPMANGRGVSDADIDKLLKSKKMVKELKGDGDFRSAECIEYLKQADIVVTNPPFSLFREYVAQLIEYDKKFIIIGNLNALHYKEFFPLIIQNKVWMGSTVFNGGATYFIAPQEIYDPSKMYNPKNAYLKDGLFYWRVNGVRWYTNLDHKKRHEELVLYKTYTPEDYPKYDNYDAIEVGKVVDIPKDYFGIMGVPDSFLEKYNPQQFEVLGCTQRGCHDLVPDTKKYDDYIEMSNKTKQPTGSKGGKTNENANLVKNDGVHNYFINKEGHIVQSAYSRLFIRRKESNK